MLRLALDKATGEPLKVLCLGAHSDDIEIGCGGTIIKLAERRSDTMFYWVVFSADQLRAEEARKSASAFLENGKSNSIIVKNFRESYFPYCGAEIKEYFDELKKAFSPDIVLTHHRNDLHQDHRLISDLTWNSFRDHLILEYEIPKYDADLGTPNFFVHLDVATAVRKVETILESFKSQNSKQWFDAETFFSVLRLRGIESNSSAKYAEAFHCRKLVLG